MRYNFKKQKEKEKGFESIDWEKEKKWNDHLSRVYP